MTTSLKFSQDIKAPLSQVYLAFINATLLREWFCDIATTKPSPGGRFYVSWNNNYYVSGDFISLEKELQISINWLGKDDPGKTVVMIKFSQLNDITKVEIEHSGIGSTSEWENLSKEINKGWNLRLENLKSILETGEDLRITRRPMLGIILDTIDENGITISEVVEGLGAYDAGLRKGDIIKKFDGVEVTDYGNFNTLLSKHKAGDEIEVEYQRQSINNKIVMKLSARKIHPIPWNPKEFSKEIEKRNKEIEIKLENILQGITEKEAAYKPDKNQWSVMEIIAHLIHGQRGIHNQLSEMIGMQESVADDFGGNQNAAVIATTRTYPTIQEIVEAYKRSNKEIVEYISELPPEFIARKSSYWRLAFQLLETPYHFNIHEEQMREVLKKAKSA